METKTAAATFRVDQKATPGDAGQFEALVSVFGNVDMGGDRIVPGAFADTLADWKARGDPIPVIWSHEAADPFSHIGEVLDAQETDAGLTIRAQLDLDAPKAAQVWRLLKGRRVTQFSFAYDVVDDAWTREGDDVVHELRKLKLFEVGPTLVGMNPATQLLSAKSDATLRRARALLAERDDALLAKARRASADIAAQLERRRSS